MNILVTGGAGYIGSHTCKALKKEGFNPIAYDNLSRGHESSVKWGPLIHGDISDTEALTNALVKWNIQGVIHFAAFAYVGESVSSPDLYYENNVLGSLSLLKAMRDASVKNLVFSSTCAVYGVPTELPIREEFAKNPINPYGSSKLMVEKMIADFESAFHLKAVVLRYFNAAGADPELEIGENHDPEPHLIPLAIDATFSDGKPLTIFGTNHPTPDGTCVRDFIHVSDLSAAHVLALTYLFKSSKGNVFNLGNGSGSSILEVISMVEKVTGNPVVRSMGARREGDPAILIADNSRARTELGWVPKHELEKIIQTAYDWVIKRRS